MNERAEDVPDEDDVVTRVGFAVDFQVRNDSLNKAGFACRYNRSKTKGSSLFKPVVAEETINKSR